MALQSSGILTRQHALGGTAEYLTVDKYKKEKAQCLHEARSRGLQQATGIRKQYKNSKKMSPIITSALLTPSKADVIFLLALLLITIHYFLSSTPSASSTITNPIQ